MSHKTLECDIWSKFTAKINMIDTHRKTTLIKSMVLTFKLDLLSFQGTRVGHGPIRFDYNENRTGLEIF